MINWIRYSGISIVISLNPLWWKVLPWCRNETTNEWPEARTYAFGFLGLTIRVWLDNGKW